MNDMTETFDTPLAHEEKESAHVSAPASAQAAGDAPVPEKKERRAKAKKAPTATKAARSKAPKAPREKTPKPEKRRVFDTSMLPPEKLERVVQLFERLHKLGRKSVENMLDMGQEFHGLSLDVEDPKDWEDLVKANSDYEVKTARNWKAIHAKMGHRRAKILEHKVTPTVLIKLLPVSEETIDAVIAAFGEGHRLKVNEVRALVDGSKEAGDAEPKPQGGMKALRVLAAAKLARQQKSVTTALKAIRQAFGASLEAKKLEKGKLAKELTPIAKLAHRELTEILCDIDPRSLFGGQALRHLKVEDANWARLLDILYTLAVAEDWPDKSKLTAWLSDEVMPLLAFSIDGAEIAIRSEEQVEVLAEAAAVDGLSGDDVVEPEPTSKAEVIAVIDAPTLPDVEPSVEVEAKPVEVKAAATPDVVAAPKPRRFNLALARSPDVTAKAPVVDMAGRANHAEASAIGSNGPA